MLEQKAGEPCPIRQLKRVVSLVQSRTKVARLTRPNPPSDRVLVEVDAIDLKIKPVEGKGLDQAKYGLSIEPTSVSRLLTRRKSSWGGSHVDTH